MLVPLTDAPRDSLLTLASAHSLVRLEETEQPKTGEAKSSTGPSIIGDPMEKNTLESSGFTISSADTVTPIKDTKGKTVAASAIKILRRFAFSSQLKRMSTVSQVDGKGELFIACKGAPETVSAFLKSVPEAYTSTYKYWARRGSRVLALACKRIPSTGASGKKAAHALTRDSVESDLEFAGFLIFSCPLKPDSKKSVRELNGSSHRV